MSETQHLTDYLVGFPYVNPTYNLIDVAMWCICNQPIYTQKLPIRQGDCPVRIWGWTREIALQWLVRSLTQTKTTRLLDRVKVRGLRRSPLSSLKALAISIIVHKNIKNKTMNEQTSNHSPSQKASNQRGNVTQVGRDYTNTTNLSFVASFFIIGVLALGGLAWALNVGLNQNPSNPILKPQQSSSTSVVETKL